ncbi:MAG: hypothetical protein F6K18_09530 [Okeania sp. SIO2C2]|uniref:hypothetical protein n=1 Tax=Okeania sp. SIO2C2 TaxID=2607787 RepID=UPI0013BA02A9|nr:hypothetical protein [Okeania sp. SIO2C2]NEP87055.1 hypothetical protein [Okeania sp. SIO2C2]
MLHTLEPTFRTTECSIKEEDRRQETTHPSPLPLPGGEDRRNGNYRGGSRKNCPLTFLP